eukprot:g19186.t1
MTRMDLSAVAIVAAAAALAKQASCQDYDTPLISGDGEKDAAVYIGCFHDNKDDRVLGDKFHSPDMTHGVCLAYCTELGAAFMATQYGFECWCSSDGGLDYNRHYEITGEDAVCNMLCEGDECGGVDWTGSKCCLEGYECVDVSGEGCYSQCRPIRTEETTPSPIDPVTNEPVTVTPETEAPVPAPTPPPVTPETKPPVPAPTPTPVTPETDPPVSAPTPSPVAPNTEPPMPAPTAEQATPTPGNSAPAGMQDLLDLHNEARCKHNARPLTWSNEVAASAAVHAKFLSDTCIEDWDHSDRADRFNGADVGQVKTNDVLKFGGHASQILWKATERLGCATSVCTSGERPGTYLVCQYDPTGNVLGKYEDQLELPTNAGNC